MRAEDSRIPTQRDLSTFARPQSQAPEKIKQIWTYFIGDPRLPDSTAHLRQTILAAPTVLRIMAHAQSETACDGCYGNPTLPKKTDERKFLLAPKAGEANKRAFYLCPGFKWLLLCMSDIGYYCMCVDTIKYS